MTPQQIVGLFVRLFAIWLLVQALQMVGYGLAQEKQAANGITSFVIAAVLAGSAAALWLFPMAVAHKLIPRTHYSDRVSAPVLDIAAVACVVLGLWVMAAYALPGISPFLAIAIMLKGTQSAWNIDWWYLTAFITGVMQLVAALILMLKARPIAAHLLFPKQADGDIDA